MHAPRGLFNIKIEGLPGLAYACIKVHRPVPMQLADPDSVVVRVERLVGGFLL